MAKNDTQKMLIIHNLSGSHQLYSFDSKTGKDRQLSYVEGGKVFGSISSGGNWIFYLDDRDGSEVGHFVQVPFDGGAPQNISPNIPLYSSFFVRTNADDSVYVWTAAYDGKHTVYRVLSSDNQLQEPEAIYESENFIDTPLISSSGRFICFNEEEAIDSIVHHRIRCFDSVEKKMITVGPWASYNEIQPVTFLGSDESTIIATYKEGEYKRTILLDIKTDNVVKIRFDEAKGDIYPLFYFEPKKQLLLSNDHEAKQKLYIFSLEEKAIKNIPLTSGSFLSWHGAAHVNAKEEVIIQWENASHPSCITVLAGENEFVPKPIYPLSNKIANVSWEEVYFQSKSGHQIQAWMVAPVDRQSAVPFVISAHGGPHSVSLDVFTPEALMWIEQGYGFMAVNYSGSTSFGESFRISIRGKPGKLEAMDMVAAREYIVGRGIADPERILLTGWSWGGFITLLTLGLYPKLWMAGIAGIPVADTVAAYEDEMPSMQTLDHELFGGSPSEVRNIYLESSPISYVQNISDPILIIHAKNDSRCPARQVENFIAEMKKAGKSIEEYWFNSGHLGHFSNPDIAVQNYTVALDFIKKLRDKNT